MKVKGGDCLCTYFRTSVGQFEFLLAELGSHMYHTHFIISMIIYSVQILSYKYSYCQMQQSDGQICLFAKKKNGRKFFS